MERRKIFIAYIILALLISSAVLAKMPEEVEKKRNDRFVKDTINLEDITEKIGTKEITATPRVVPTGQEVTLRWKVLPKNPGDVINAKIEVHYEGFNSGKFIDLPKTGQMTICPLGDTTYYLAISIGDEQTRLAEVNVKSPCPVVTITEENMQEIAQSVKPGMVTFDPNITIKDIILKINPYGISILLEIKKKMEVFPDIDIKMDVLAYPKIEGNHIKMDIRRYDIDIPIASKERRMIIGIFTFGISEGLLKGLEYYCKDKYSLKVKEEIEKRFNRFATFKPDDTPIVRLSKGKMDFIICKKCK